MLQKASCFHRSTVLTETATSMPPLLFRSLCGTNNVDAAAAAVVVLVLGPASGIGTAIAVGTTLVFVLVEDNDDDDDDNKLLAG